MNWFICLITFYSLFPSVGWSEPAAEPLFLYELAMDVKDERKNVKQLKTLTVKASNLLDLESYYKKIGLKFTTNNQEIQLELRDITRHRYTPARRWTTYKSASFLIDFDHINFTEVKRQVDQRYGGRPTPLELQEFVFNYIDRKIAFRGFEPASFVAKHEAANTTGHTTLLTALLRLYKYPAVMVSGIVVKKLPRAAMAFGRAWSYYFQEGKWYRLDPMEKIETMTQVPVLFYMPYAEVENETVDFKRELILQKGQRPIQMHFIL